MIPKKKYTEVISSGQMATAEATIEMTPEMFGILSSQVYPNKILACVRETLCNARDANVEAGVDTPLELHLPNALEPYYYILDTGNGMSEQEVMGLYLRYGYSSKKDTNSAIGGMGIGSKAPFAYADAFTVTSTQSGLRKTYSVYKDNGKPCISKLNTTQTAEPDGIKVQVNVETDDGSSFRSEVQTLLKYFDFPVNVVGDLSFKRETLEIMLDSAQYKIVKDPGYGNSGKVSVLMGGLKYEISGREGSSDSLAKLQEVVANRSESLFLKFDIGDLTVTASRESISQDKETNEMMDLVVQDVLDNLVEDRIKLVQAAKTPNEAIKLLVEFKLVTWIYKRLKGGYGWHYNIPEDTVVLGMPVTTLSEVANTSVRFFSWDNYTFSELRQNYRTPWLFVRDKSTGHVLVAKHAKKLEACDAIVMINKEDEDTIKAVENYYGITRRSLKEYYNIIKPKLPKAERTGAINSKVVTDVYGDRVGEVDTEEGGFIIPTNKGTIEMEGVPPSFAWELSDIVRGLSRDGYLGDNCLMVGRSAIKSFKKGDRVILTWAKIESIMKLNKVELEELAELNRDCLDSTVQAAVRRWSVLRTSGLFPKHSAQYMGTKKLTSAKVSTIHAMLCVNALERMYPDLGDLITKANTVVSEEHDVLLDKFPLLADLVNVTSGLTKDVEEYIISKL